MFKKSHAAVTLLMLIGAVSTANATVYSTTASTIYNIDSYTQYGNGDVIFKLTTNSLQTSCPYGFWIRNTDGGGKSVIAQVMLAYANGSSVVVGADTSTIWSGAGSAACLVWDVVLQPQ